MLQVDGPQSNQWVSVVMGDHRGAVIRRQDQTGKTRNTKSMCFLDVAFQHGLAGFVCHLFLEFLNIDTDLAGKLAERLNIRGIPRLPIVSHLNLFDHFCFVMRTKMFCR